MNLTRESYKRIRQSLLSGDGLLNQRFSINRLSKQLGIGRSPVRDAVTQLAAEGLLQSVAKSGVVVRSISYAELQDIIGLRETLEPYAVTQACARMDYGQLEKLRWDCHEFSKLARQTYDFGFLDEEINRAMRTIDWRFHNLILAASGNRMLHKIIEDYQLLLCKVRYPSVRSSRHLARTITEHWRIYRALKRGDAAAAGHWMLRHVRRGGNAMLQSWRETRG